MCRDGFLSIRWTIDWSWELLATVFVAPPGDTTTVPSQLAGSPNQS